MNLPFAFKQHIVTGGGWDSKSEDCRDQCADCPSWEDSEWEIIDPTTNGSWDLSDKDKPVFNHGSDVNCTEGDGLYRGRVRRRFFAPCGTRFWGEVTGLVERMSCGFDNAEILVWIGSASVQRVAYIHGTGEGLTCRDEDGNPVDVPMAEACDSGSYGLERGCAQIELRVYSGDGLFHAAGSFTFDLKLDPESEAGCSYDPPCQSVRPPGGDDDDWKDPPDPDPDGRCQDIQANVVCDSLYGCGTVCGFERTNPDTGERRYFRRRIRESLDVEHEEREQFGPSGFTAHKTVTDRRRIVEHLDLTDGVCQLVCEEREQEVTCSESGNYYSACSGEDVKHETGCENSNAHEPVAPENIDDCGSFDECPEGTLPYPDDGIVQCCSNTQTSTFELFERTYVFQDALTQKDPWTEQIELQARINRRREARRIFEDEITDFTEEADPATLEEGPACSTLLEFTSNSTGNACAPFSGPGFCVRKVSFTATFTGLQAECGYSVVARIRKTYTGGSSCGEPEEYDEVLGGLSGVTDAVVTGELPVEMWRQYELLEVWAVGQS